MNAILHIMFFCILCCSTAAKHIWVSYKYDRLWRALWAMNFRFSCLITLVHMVLPSGPVYIIHTAGLYSKLSWVYTTLSFIEHWCQCTCSTCMYLDKECRHVHNLRWLKISNNSQCFSLFSCLLFPNTKLRFIWRSCIWVTHDRFQSFSGFCHNLSLPDKGENNCRMKCFFKSCDGYKSWF